MKILQPANHKHSSISIMSESKVHTMVNELYYKLNQRKQVACLPPSM